MCTDGKSGIGGKPLPGQSPQKKGSIYPKGVGGDKPAWLAFDRQVLSFSAYYQEVVHEKANEEYRIRKCVVYFYLEDDSIQVIEQKMENSGIPQGTLIRRHRIPLPPPNDDKFYTVDHFNIGNEVTFYSKTFKITGCDQFTKNFLRKLGVRVNDEDTIPADPFTMDRQSMLEAMQPLRPYEKLDTLRQFLDHDKQVLRFYCVWDNRDNMFGDPRHMVLHYFLADDTVEVLEKIPENSGRDAIPVFLRRARLMKDVSPMNQPGVDTKRTVLNVFGPMGHGGRYILDSLKTGEVHAEYYHDSDLTLGGVVNVWGRKLLLYDCDDFTKEYYRTKYGIENFTPVDVPEPQVPELPYEVPPYEGFQIGSQEDSLANCLNLIPKPPKRDFIKFMEKDRHGLDSNVLRFVACLDTTKPIDMDRRFIVSFFLSDDTISVYEPSQRNSGIIGGKFLERSRIAKPALSPDEPTVYYLPDDFYVGGRVEFNSHKFILIDTDEYALKYMEKYFEQFPHANISLILSKLKGPAQAQASSVQAAFQGADSRGSGKLDYGRFRQLVLKLAGGLLNEHEVMTIGRHFGGRKPPVLKTLVKLVQDDLKKKNYSSFQQVKDSLEYHDAEGSGYLSTDQILHLCKHFKLPLTDQLIEGILMCVEHDDRDWANYVQFVSLLDWQNNPVQVEKTDRPAGTSGDPFRGFGDQRETVQEVDYRGLFKELLS